MSKFALQEFTNVIGKIKFFKLFEKGACQWDAFCDEIRKDSNLETQLITIISRMNDVANLRMLPKTKLRDITPAKEKLKEYEIKTRDLRVYFIKNSIGNIILVSGKKNSQPEDIKKFRSVKKAYVEETKNDKR